MYDVWCECFWYGVLAVTWRHTAWLHSSPWWRPLLTWWWTACWEVALGFVSSALQHLAIKKEDKSIRSKVNNTPTLSVCLCKLTLCGFEFLLQRHQLQSQVLGHLLVLLLLPVIYIQSDDQLFEYNATEQAAFTVSHRTFLCTWPAVCTSSGPFLRKPFMGEVIKWWLLRSIWLFRFQGPGIVQAGWLSLLLGHLNRADVL